MDIYEILETATDLRARFVNRDFAEEVRGVAAHLLIWLSQASVMTLDEVP